MVDKERQEEYLEQLVSSMRSRNFSSELVRHTLIDVEALLEETGGDPVEVCGQPWELAEKVEAQLTAGGRDPAEAFVEPLPFREKALARLEALDASISGQSEETFEERGGRTPANSVLAALRWLWVAVPPLLFIAAGLVLAGVGMLFAFVGVRAVIGPDGLAGTMAGVLFAVGGSAAACGGVLTAVWVMLRTAGKPAGRTPVGRVMNGVAAMVLSLVYFASWASLLGFGAACAWNGLGPGSSTDFDHPVAGVVMLASGIVVLFSFPRHIKKLTGHDVLSKSGGGFHGGGGGDGGGF